MSLGYENNPGKYLGAKEHEACSLFSNGSDTELHVYTHVYTHAHTEQLGSKRGNM